jgi:UDP-glucose 4-epimerase
MNLINAAVNHNTKCLVFASSIAVYGAGQVPMSESMVPQPEDPYGISKYAVELDLHSANAMFGLRYVIFRPHNVYGDNQNIGDRYRNVIGIFMNQLMQDLPMTIFGDGEQTRAFTHIADVAPVIAEAVDNPRAQNEVFNVGAETPYSVNYLAEVVAKAMKKSANKVHLPPRKEVVHAFSSHAKTRSVFGRKPAVTLEEGVSRMAEWARRVGPRQTKAFQGIEVRKNLPPSWASQNGVSDAG